MDRIKAFLFGASLATLGTAALAQNVGSATQPATAGASESGNIGDIVVTAQRREERLHDVPLTVAAASSLDLQRAGVFTVRDLGRVVSGFTLSGQGFLAQPAIRGVSTFVSDGVGGSPNALYIDGVYQPLFTALSAELSDIDRIEVLKGPQGTLFGRNATGGAIQVFTTRPSFDPHMNLKLGLGAFTGGGSSRSSLNSTASAFVTGPIVSDTVAASLSAGYRYAPGYLTNDVTGDRDGEIRKSYVHGKLLIKPAENVELLAEGHYLSFDNLGEGAQSPYKGLTAANAYPGSIIPSQPWHIAYNLPVYIHYDQHGGSLTGKVDVDIGTITSITAFDRSRIDVFNAAHASQAPIACFIAFACLDDQFVSVTKTFQQEVNFASRDFGRFSFTAGLFYLNQRSATVFYVQPQLAPPQGIPVLQLGLKGQSYAAYGEATWKITDKFSVIGGLRYSKEDDNDSPLPTLPNIKHSEDAITPRVAVKYEVSRALNVYASFSQGYKAGLSGASNTGSTPQFLPVAPERINSFEVGTKYSARNFSFNLAGWYYQYKNKQESLYQGTVSIQQNTGPVRIYGLDADTALQIGRDFSIQANLSYIPVAKFLDFPNAAGNSYIQDGTGVFLPGSGLAVQSCPTGARPGCVATGSSSFDATGLRIPRAPKLSGNLTFAFAHATDAGKWDASATLSYSSKVSQAVNQAVVQPAYATVGAQAGYRFGNSGLRVGVYGQNLTNHVIIQGSISSTAGHLQTIAAPREVGVRAEYSF